MNSRRWQRDDGRHRARRSTGEPGGRLTPAAAAPRAVGASSLRWLMRLPLPCSPIGAGLLIGRCAWFATGHLPAAIGPRCRGAGTAIAGAAGLDAGMARCACRDVSGHDRSNAPCRETETRVYYTTPSTAARPPGRLPRIAYCSPRSPPRAGSCHQLRQDPDAGERRVAADRQARDHAGSTREN